MTTFPSTLTAGVDFDARVPELDAALVVRAYETAQVLREMRAETPRCDLRAINDLMMLITAYLSRKTKHHD